MGTRERRSPRLLRSCASFARWCRWFGRSERLPAHDADSAREAIAIRRRHEEVAKAHLPERCDRDPYAMRRGARDRLLARPRRREEHRRRQHRAWLGSEAIEQERERASSLETNTLSTRRAKPGAAMTDDE